MGIESYQPSKKEVRDAEKIMTDSQKELSDKRVEDQYQPKAKEITKAEQSMSESEKLMSDERAQQKFVDLIMAEMDEDAFKSDNIHYILPGLASYPEMHRNIHQSQFNTIKETGMFKKKYLVDGGEFPTKEEAEKFLSGKNKERFQNKLENFYNNMDGKQQEEMLKAME